MHALLMFFIAGSDCGRLQERAVEFVPSRVREFSDVHVSEEGTFEAGNVFEAGFQMDSLMNSRGYMFAIAVKHDRFYVNPLRFVNVISGGSTYRAFSDYMMAIALSPTRFCLFRVEIK